MNDELITTSKEYYALYGMPPKVLSDEERRALNETSSDRPLPHLPPGAQVEDRRASTTGYEHAEAPAMDHIPSMAGATPSIIFAWPPNIAEIAKVFPNVLQLRPLFAWGNTIYNPKAEEIHPSLLEHEKLHGIRQLREGSIEGWWAKYLVDPQFRLCEEFPCHLVELQWFANTGRNQRRFALKTIAARLSGPFYGNLLTPAKAIAALKSGILPC